VLGLWDPLAAYNASLLLSAAATWGLLYVAGPLGDRLARPLPLAFHPLTTTAATTLAASLACAPVLASLSPSLPWLGVATNLVAVPLGEAAALPLCMLHTVLAPLPLFEGAVARVGVGTLLALRFLARVTARPEWAAVPVPPPTELHYAVLAWTLAAWWSLAPHRWAPAVLAGAAGLLVAEFDDFLQRASKTVQQQAAAAPRDPDGFLAWFVALRTSGSGQNDSLFPWLATRASYGHVRWFLTQKVAGEAGFDDLVALTQVKLPARALGNLMAGLAANRRYATPITPSGP